MQVIKAIISLMDNSDEFRLLGRPQTYLYLSLITGKGARQRTQWQREMEFKLWIRHDYTARQMTVQPQRPL